MAEAYLNYLAQDRFNCFSAGLKKGVLNPIVVNGAINKYANIYNLLTFITAKNGNNANPKIAIQYDENDKYRLSISIFF